jgi:hypothetical protein
MSISVSIDKNLCYRLNESIVATLCFFCPCLFVCLFVWYSLQEQTQKSSWLQMNASLILSKKFLTSPIIFLIKVDPYWTKRMTKVYWVVGDNGSLEWWSGRNWVCIVHVWNELCDTASSGPREQKWHSPLLFLHKWNPFQVNSKSSFQKYLLWDIKLQWMNDIHPFFIWSHNWTIWPTNEWREQKDCVPSTLWIHL